MRRSSWVSALLIICVASAPSNTFPISLNLIATKLVVVCEEVLEQAQRFREPRELGGWTVATCHISSTRRSLRPLVCWPRQPTSSHDAILCTCPAWWTIYVTLSPTRRTSPSSTWTRKSRAWTPVLLRDERLTERSSSLWSGVAAMLNIRICRNTHDSNLPRPLVVSCT